MLLPEGLSRQVILPIPGQVVRLILEQSQTVDGRPRPPLTQIGDAKGVELGWQEPARAVLSEETGAEDCIVDTIRVGL